MTYIRIGLVAVGVAAVGFLARGASPPRLSSYAPMPVENTITQVVVQGSRFVPGLVPMVSAGTPGMIISQGVVSNVSATSFVWTLPALTPGTIYLRVRNLDGKVSNQLTVTVIKAPIVPPPPSSLYGPTPTITCPVSAVSISAGSSIQSAVTANPEGASFCLGVGIHFITASITPKSGNTFTGEYGAVLDGTGWASSNLDDAAFRAVNVGVRVVTVRNLVIRNMPQSCIKVFDAVSSAWMIEYNDILNCATKGVQLGKDDIARHNKIHNNPNGNYAAFQGHRALFEENEISYGGNEQKIVDARDVVFRSNWVHHNFGNGGIWYDAAHSGMLVENNIVEYNDGEGIFIEQSPTNVGTGTSSINIVRNNTVRWNTVSGIFISIAHYVEIYGNTLTGNGRGITYFIDCVRIDPGVDDLMHVNSHDNTIVVADAPDSFASAFSFLGTCSSTTISPYVNFQKDLVFQNNHYDVPNPSSGLEWVWGNSFKTWAQWQALSQDSTGNVY